MVKKANRIALSFDNRKRFTAFFEVLIKVSERDKKEFKSKRKRKSKLKSDDLGSRYSEPFYFVLFSDLVLNALE